jgi:uncharacterized protein (TIGR00251 family)
VSIVATASGVRLTLHVRPGASRTALTGQHGDAIGVCLAAPPVDGKANQLLIEFLAARLGVPRRAVSLVAGMHSRKKIVAVSGIDVPAARSRTRPQ